MTTLNPWDDEPDYKEGKFCSLKYEIRRNLDTGSLCGYITLPNTDKYTTIDDYDSPELDNIPIHGGWTYTDITPDNIVIGFDCAHHGDLIPMMELMTDQMKGDPMIYDGTYKTITYVEEQLKKACWLLTGNKLDTNLHIALYERYSTNGERV